VGGFSGVTCEVSKDVGAIERDYLKGERVRRGSEDHWEEE